MSLRRGLWALARPVCTFGALGVSRALADTQEEQEFATPLSARHAGANAVRPADPGAEQPSWTPSVPSLADTWAPRPVVAHSAPPRNRRSPPIRKPTSQQLWASGGDGSETCGLCGDTAWGSCARCWLPRRGRRPWAVGQWSHQLWPLPRPGVLRVARTEVPWLLFTLARLPGLSLPRVSTDHGRARVCSAQLPLSPEVAVTPGHEGTHC